mmetsp:Transcript_121143/g.353999  ORF Transcript_121143/g.353999 Transcript_121143/m.353999 type:complete len:230 (+) Transcript_121143:29-718(+)
MAWQPIRPRRTQPRRGSLQPRGQGGRPPTRREPPQSVTPSASDSVGCALAPPGDQWTFRERGVSKEQLVVPLLPPGAWCCGLLSAATAIRGPAATTSWLELGLGRSGGELSAEGLRCELPARGLGRRWSSAAAGRRSSSAFSAPPRSCTQAGAEKVLCIGGSTSQLATSGERPSTCVSGGSPAGSVSAGAGLRRPASICCPGLCGTPAEARGRSRCCPLPRPGQRCLVL